MSTSVLVDSMSFSTYETLASVNITTATRDAASSAHSRAASRPTSHAVSNSHGIVIACTATRLRPKAADTAAYVT